MIRSLDDAQRHITRGWIAGVVMGSMTLLTAITGSARLPAYSRFGYADAMFAFLLAFGLYRRSRVAAVAISILFIATTVFKVAWVGPQPLFLLFAAAFAYLYVQAARGTWAYHKLSASSTDPTAPSTKQAA